MGRGRGSGSKAGGARPGRTRPSAVGTRGDRQDKSPQAYAAQRREGEASAARRDDGPRDGRTNAQKRAAGDKADRATLRAARAKEAARERQAKKPAGGKRKKNRAAVQAAKRLSNRAGSRRKPAANQASLF